jgi:hypothetical protein
MPEPYPPQPRLINNNRLTANNDFMLASLTTVTPVRWSLFQLHLLSLIDDRGVASLGCHGEAK